MKKSQNSGACIDVLAREYIEQLEARRYSPRSVDSYGRALQDFIASVRRSDVRTIGLRDLEQYRAALLARKFKGSSVLVYFQALKLFFRYLEEQQLIFENPCAKLAPMRLSRTLQPVPTEAEMVLLLGRPDVGTPTGVRDRALLETAYSTGARRKEILDMRVDGVELDAGRLRVMGKGSRERMVPLGAEAVRWLGAYLADVRPALLRKGDIAALWLAKNGRALYDGALEQIMLRYRRAPGIATRIGLHSIRRACATHMLRRGASPVAIQALLGHSAMGHLSQYLRLSLTDVKAMHEGSRVGQ